MFGHLDAEYRSVIRVTASRTGRNVGLFGRYNRDKAGTIFSDLSG